MYIARKHVISFSRLIHENIKSCYSVYKMDFSRQYSSTKLLLLLALLIPNLHIVAFDSFFYSAINNFSLSVATYDLNCFQNSLIMFVKYMYFDET